MSTETTHSVPPAPDPDEALRKCCNILAEHFSSVQILVTRLLPDGKTAFGAWGAGDFYARIGAAKTFIDRQMADNIGEFVVWHQNGG
ncbi:MAG: hypothetical protein H7210_13435 [Pyrinomonadaceae bacterium]|nr:hypothetical protein [Phycisphaerales bacterium]